jgi:hypothetical protein
MLNRFMVQNGFTQRPQLDGPANLQHRSFLSEYDFGDPALVAKITLEDIQDEEEPVGEVIVSKPTQNVTVDSSTTVNIGGVDNSTTKPTPKPNKKDDDEDDDKKKKTMLMIGVGVLVAIAVAVFAF